MQPYPNGHSTIEGGRSSYSSTGAPYAGAPSNHHPHHPRPQAHPTANGTQDTSGTGTGSGTNNSSAVSVNMDDSIMSAAVQYASESAHEAAAISAAAAAAAAGGGVSVGGADDGDAESAVEGQPSKKRRNRRPISCKNCRRRKLKCDRGNPCGSCRDRNEADQCSWDDAIRVPPETATRGVEALELRSQLDRLEGLLGALMGGHNDSGGPVFPGSNSTHAHLAELVSARSGGYSPLDGVSGPYAPTLHHLGPTSTSTSGSIRPGSDAYARLAGLLPPPEALHELLTFFRSHILYLLPVVHFPTLLSRVANFDRSPSAARQDRDPAFLALLLAMTGIARTAKGTQVEYATAMTGYTGFSAGAEVQGCSPADGKVGAAMRSGKELVDAAVESLRLSDYMAHPTLDCIRVLVLLNHFHRFDSSTKPILILSEALTLARAMELNRDPTKTNPAEGRIEVEERRRLWAMLKAAEATQGPGRGLAGMLGEADTEAPANANDEDVTPTSVKVYPITTLTDSTPLLILIEVGELARRITREVYSLGARPSYQTILDLNNALESLTNSLPQAMSFPWNQTGTGVIVPRSTAPGKEWFRFILHLALRGLYVRLHHPFLIRGFVDERFEFNRDSCLAAARFTLACHRGLAEDPRALSCRFVIADACNALFILSVDLFQDPFGKNAAAHRSDIGSSTTLLRHCESAESELVGRTLKVVTELVNRASSGGSLKRKRSPHGNGTVLDPSLVYSNGFSSGSASPTRPTLPPQPPLDRSVPFPRALPIPMSSEAWRVSSNDPSGAHDPLLDLWNDVAKLPMYAVPDRRAWKELVQGTWFASGLDILQP